MRVLYFIDSLAGGGAEHSLVALAPKFGAAGIVLDVAYLHDRPGLQSQLEEAGARLFSLAGRGGRIGWIRQARRLIEQRSPDLVHTTLFEADITGRIAGSLAGVPIVSSLVSLAYGPEQLRNPRLNPLKVRAAQVLDALTARRVARFHAVTGQVADVMARRLRIPRGRIDVVPRGRDPAELGVRSADRRASARSSLRVEPETTLLLAAARHEYQKGLDLLIEAMPLVLRGLPNAHLAIAGREGDHTPTLGAAVTRFGLGGAVSFLGHREDVAELMCAADLVVVPSRWEGLPGTILEAMALEVPIVASDIPPISEAAPAAAYARLVPPGKPEGLAEAVILTVREATEAQARARRARVRFLERFTIDRSSEGMVAFYRRALSDR